MGRASLVSATSGGQIECPTCFQKIVVPQAPSLADPKFILSASQVGKPRPAPSGTESQVDPASPPRTTIPIIAILALLLCVAGAALYVFRGKIFKSAGSQAQSKTNRLAQTHPVVPMTVYPIPTNINWTLDLTNAAFPDTVAAGSIHRRSGRRLHPRRVGDRDRGHGPPADDVARRVPPLRAARLGSTASPSFAPRLRGPTCATLPASALSASSRSAQRTCSRRRRWRTLAR